MGHHPSIWSNRALVEWLDRLPPSTALATRTPIDDTLRKTRTALTYQ